MELKTVNQIGTFGPGLSEVAFRKRIADLLNDSTRKKKPLKNTFCLSNWNHRAPITIIKQVPFSKLGKEVKRLLTTIEKQ